MACAVALAVADLVAFAFLVTTGFDVALFVALAVADELAVGVEAAAGETELVANVDRLYGTNLMRRQAPIVNMIDDATGKTDDDMQTFLRFVWNCVFIRCAPISSKNAAHLAAADRQTE